MTDDTTFSDDAQSPTGTRPLECPVSVFPTVRPRCHSRSCPLAAPGPYSHRRVRRAGEKVAAHSPQATNTPSPRRRPPCQPLRPAVPSRHATKTCPLMTSSWRVPIRSTWISTMCLSRKRSRPSSPPCPPWSMPLSPRAVGGSRWALPCGTLAAEDYKHAWRVVRADFGKRWPAVHVNTDNGLNYVTALCYVSHDPALYVNPDAVPWRSPRRRGRGSAGGAQDGQRRASLPPLRHSQLR